jgi:cytochrome P450
MGLGNSMPLLPYGAEWRAHRKLARIALNAGALTKYHHVQEELAVLLMKDLLESPDQLFSHVRLYVFAIFLFLRI